MNRLANRLGNLSRKPIHIPLRLSLWTLAALFSFAVAVDQIGAKMPRPVFVLAHDQASLEPLHLQPLRQLSDRLARKKYALLTFDDGPYGNGVDEKIIQILKRHHAHALFFLVCNHLSRSTLHVPKEILESGNLIGNHSYDHAHLGKLGLADLQHEIKDCSTRLASVTGEWPRYFRPPFGQSSPEVLASIASAGMEQMLWDANSEDSWQTRSAQIQHWAMEQTDDRSILLMHDRPATAAALDGVLSNLEKEGFVFVLPAERNPFESPLQYSRPGSMRSGGPH